MELTISCRKHRPDSGLCRYTNKATLEQLRASCGSIPASHFESSSRAYQILSVDIHGTCSSQLYSSFLCADLHDTASGCRGNCPRHFEKQDDHLYPGEFRAYHADTGSSYQGRTAATSWVCWYPVPEKRRNRRDHRRAGLACSFGSLYSGPR